MIPNSWFCGNDVVKIAREMIGMEILTKINDGITSGIIVETEAYAGVSDRASHAWNGRRTKRTEIMYHAGGTIYVYLCYGIHSLLNIVTNKIDIPEAVLLRTIKPVNGIDLMLKRLEKSHIPNVLYGPGNISKALGVHFSHSGMILGEKSPKTKMEICILKKHNPLEYNNIVASKRIGVDYAGQDALFPYRFTWMPNK